MKLVPEFTNSNFYASLKVSGTLGYSGGGRKVKETCSRRCIEVTA
jgi:hypothetical protein